MTLFDLPRRVTTRTRLSLLVAIAGATLLGAGGCTAPPSRTSSLDPALSAYSAGRYKEARDEADRAMSVSSGAEHDQAAYVAGLSAYRLGDLDGAERRLTEVARSTNGGEAPANARATLGLVRLAQDRPREASELFRAAARDLPPDSALRAEEQARRADGQAVRGSSGAVARRQTGATADAGSFTLQVGAFSDRARAEQAAGDATATAKQAQLGSVRITPKRDGRGRQLYVVQVGSFRSRQEAAQARSRLGKLEYIVAAAE